MSDTPDTLGLIEPPPETPRRRLKRRYFVAVGAALAAGGVAVTLGPAAPWFVEHFANNQRVWRLGQLHVEGVSGGWIGDLRVERLALEDSDGVWVEARDVALNWRPFDMFGGVRIDSAHAGVIDVLRQPILSERRPPSRASMDVLIDHIRVDELHIAEAVFDQDARFTLDLGLRVRDKTLDQIALDLRRTDSDIDHALVHYDAESADAFSVDIEGQAGGVLAAALGVPERAVRLTGTGEGDITAGAAHFEGAIGPDELTRGETRWTATGWSLEADTRLDLLPATQTLARRIGASVSLQASGARHGAFTAHAQTPFLAIDLGGVLDDEFALDGPARFTASTQRLSDIARETPFEFGAATLTGELRRANGTTAIRAELDARDIDALGRRARFSGPVEASLTPDRFTLESDLRAPPGIARPLRQCARNSDHEL